MDTQMKTDTLDIINTINTHEWSMFKKGPPKDQGFMWCKNDDVYWTVLGKGWDSSGYGIMMRNLQNDIYEIFG